MIPFERSSGIHSSPSQPATLSLREPPPTNSPGNRIGVTYYDLQKYGSMGHMIAGNQINGYIFMAWTAQDDTIIPGDCGIKVQAYDALGPFPNYVLDAGGYPATDPDYACYAACAWGPFNNEAAFACYVDPGIGIFRTTYYYDGLPNSFIFYRTFLEASQDSSWYSSDIIWPTMSVHEGDNPNVTEDVVYVLSRVWTDSEDLILYRGVGSPPVWDSGQYIETVDNLSHVICADPNSDKVAIVYTDDLQEYEYWGEAGQFDLDVYYKLSTDQGTSWGDPICISHYSEVDDSLWRAFSDLAAVITPDENLHIIAAVRELRNQSLYENYKSRLVHWSVDLATEAVSRASVIDEAHYVMQLSPDRPCSLDDWNLYIAKPSISYCDDKLYALYTKFGDDNNPGALIDCSQKEFANGELYLSASDNYLGYPIGETWDTAWNLTNTWTPWCDSGQCESDHWSSMGAYGMVYDGVDDTLDILYVNDKDAGGIPFGNGTWCVNNVMHLRFPCRPVAHLPRISLEPHDFLDPIHTQPDQELQVNLKISNIGNEYLNISNIQAIDEGQGTNWINIGSYGSSIAPGDFVTVTITLNYNTVLDYMGDPAGYNASIEIDHNGVSDRDYVPIHLTVASDFNMPQANGLNTTCKQLMVYNTGRLGGDNEGYSLDIPGDCDSVEIPPNALMYLNNASPVIAWNNGSENLAYTTLFTQYFTEEGTFRPQSDLNFFYEPDYDMVVCTVTTSDSLYGISITLYAPNDGSNCFIIGQYAFFNWNPVKDASDVYLGIIADWDIPSDHAVDNGSGYDDTRHTIWQYGYEYQDDNIAACGGWSPSETDRLGGIAILQGPMHNAWSEENAPHQLGSGFDKEYIYSQMTTLSGYDLWSPPGDSGIDLHTGITFESVDMTAKANHEYIIALITTKEGQDDYLAQVDQARTWAIDHGVIIPFVCNCIPGDANGDGQVNIGDGVYIVSAVFKWGPVCTPYPSCSGDANHDCRTNIADAVYIISYVFNSGAAPVDCDTWHTTCGDLH